MQLLDIFLTHFKVSSLLAIPLIATIFIPLIATIFKHNLKDIIHILLWQGIEHLAIEFSLNYSEHISSKEDWRGELLISAMLAFV